MTEKRKRNTSGLVPFKKGNDPRRNLKGRPKSFDQLRELAQSIASQDFDDQTTLIEHILSTMATDKRLMKDFLEFAYGKVPIPQTLDIKGEITWKEFIEGNKSEDKND